MCLGEIGHLLFEVVAFPITSKSNGFLHLCFEINELFKRKPIDVDP